MLSNTNPTHSRQHGRQPVVDSSQVEAPNSASDGAGTTVTASTQHTTRSEPASHVVDLASDYEGSRMERRLSTTSTSLSDEEDEFDLDGNVPESIRQLEASVASWPLPTAQRVHSRYTDFLKLLCRETLTENAIIYTMIGLPEAVSTAEGLRLDQDHSSNMEHDLFAIALVIHVWQVVCMRLQHGVFSNEEDSLSTHCGTYFVSAYSIGRDLCKASQSSYKLALEHWEELLWHTGNGRQWQNKPWSANIPLENCNESPHRNETADRYLAAMDESGRGGLMPVIEDEEAKGEWTQLRKLLEDNTRLARSDMLLLLASMDDALLRAIIDWQVPRKAEIPGGAVYEALERCNAQGNSQPGTYLIAICDRMGLSPTPAHWDVVCDDMLDYIESDHDYDEYAREVDQLIHPKAEWYDGLASLGLRRYTDWKEVVDGNKMVKSSHPRDWVRNFVGQLRLRMEGKPGHAPLSVPVVEVGYSTELMSRLQQHLEHESSNYLMNLSEALFEYEFLGSFRLQQNVVYVCFRPIQTWLSEIIITQLAQEYIKGGGGFRYKTAGQLDECGYTSVADEDWDRYEKQAGATVDAYLDEYGASAERSHREMMRRQQERFAAEKRYLESVIDLVDALQELEQAQSRAGQ